jgi:hypothetical protein
MRMPAPTRNTHEQHTHTQQRKLQQHKQHPKEWF